MMNKSQMIELYSYNDWANKKLLSTEHRANQSPNSNGNPSRLY